MLLVTQNIDKITQGTFALVDLQSSNSSRVSFYRAPTPDSDWRSYKQYYFFQWRWASGTKILGFLLPHQGNSIRSNQFSLSNYVATNCHLIVTVGDLLGTNCQKLPQLFLWKRQILLVTSCTNLSPRKSGQVFDSMFFLGYKHLLWLQSEQFFSHANFRRREFTSFSRLSDSITSVGLQLKYR